MATANITAWAVRDHVELWHGVRMSGVCQGLSRAVKADVFLGPVYSSTQLKPKVRFTLARGAIAHPYLGQS